MSKKYITAGLEPEKVLNFFEDICRIPHGSYHTQMISDWLRDFAVKRNLRHIQDEAGNVIMFKDGTKGHENAEPLMLQGHMDMVLEKNSENPIDMEKEAITLMIDGDNLKADGTTLGGDDGIAVAMMLALLDSEDIVHPPLECVFTVDEEVGMLGMEALDPSPLRSKRMLNLDSEQEGVFTAGCAGGAEEELTLHVERKPQYGMQLQIEVSGLLGGHSGESIDRGRANADLVLARILYKLYKKVPFYLIGINGGSKDNAIPREASALVIFPAGSDRELAAKTIEKHAACCAAEYQQADPEMRCTCTWMEDRDLAAAAMTKKYTKRVLRLLLSLPNGLMETDQVSRTPQTSLNLGILKTDTDTVTIVFLVRSSINSQKKFLCDRLEIIADAYDAEIRTVSAYPAWEYAHHSEFRDTLAGIYEKKTGKKPVISVTHGGLECGLLAAKMDGLDCLSIGPDMEGIHTPSEKLSISSVRRCWEFLLAALEALA